MLPNQNPLPIAEGLVLYTHHYSSELSKAGRVFVMASHRGTHRDHCLCFVCTRFKPGESNNCSVAQAVFRLCVEYDLVLPVFECPFTMAEPGIVVSVLP